MPPLRHQLEVRHRLLGPDHTDRLARAVNKIAFPGPGAGIAVDIGKVILAQRPPAGSGSVQVRLGQPGGLIGHGECQGHEERGQTARESDVWSSSCG